MVYEWKFSVVSPSLFLILFFQLLWFVVYVTIAALISVSLLLFGLLFAAAWYVNRLYIYIRYESYMSIWNKTLKWFFQWLWISNSISEQDDEKWKVFQVLWWWSYYNDYHWIKLYLYTEKINRQSLKRTDYGPYVTYHLRDKTNKYIMKVGETHNIFRIIILFMGLNKTSSLMSRWFYTDFMPLSNRFYWANVSNMWRNSSARRFSTCWVLSVVRWCIELVV